MQRQSSARPTAEAVRTTQTKSFFNHLEEEENDEPTATLINVDKSRNSGSEDDEREPFLSLLQSADLDDNHLHGWNILLRTEKPRVDLVESIHLTGLRFVDRMLTKYYFSSSSWNDVIDKIETPSLVPNEFKSFLDLVQSIGTTFLRGFGVLFRSARSICVKDHIQKDAGEDGLFVSAMRSAQQSSSRSITKIEERILREDAIDKQSSSYHARPELSSNEVSITQTEESFWISPSENEPSYKRGCHKRHFQITIHVGEIKFRHHPLFSDEESALGQLNDLYVRYRDRIETGSFYHFVKRLIAIIQFVQSANALVEKSADFQVALHDMETTSEKLLNESNFIQEMSLNIQNLWVVLVQARESSGFVCTDSELQTKQSVDAEFDGATHQLLDLISSLRREGNFASTVYGCLDAVEKKIQYDDIKHFRETLLLIKTNKLDQQGWIPKDEKDRRRIISSSRYFVRLQINDHHVGDTRSNKFESFFSIRLEHRFNCCLTQIPEKICIQIFKSSSGFLPAILVCSTFIPVPNLDVVSSDREGTTELVPLIECYEFAAEDGVKGEILISTSCKTRLGAIPMQTSHMTVIPNRSFTSLIRHSHTEWKTTSTVQNDACIFDRQLAMAFKTGNVTLMTGCLEEPARHVLFKMRQNHVKCDVPSPIPISESLLMQSDRDYKSLLRRDPEVIHEEVITAAFIERNAINKQNVAHFLKAMESSLLLTEQRRARKKPQYPEIIQDVSSIRFLFDDEFEFHCFSRKRSLYPTSLRSLPTKRLPNRYSLLLSVVLGKNVPINVNPASTNHQQSLSNYESKIVADYAEESRLGLVVKIQLRGKSELGLGGKIFYTRAVAGSTSPFWNETVLIPLDFFDEHFERPHLCLRDDLVDVTIFDCKGNDLRPTGGFYDDEETKFRDYRYMGSITLPFLAVLKQGQVDGYVQCFSPELIMGYLRPGSSNSSTYPHKDGNDIDSVENTRESLGKSELMLRIFATTNPLIAFPAKFRSEYPCNESAHTLLQIDKWSEQICVDPMQTFDDRFTVLWPDTNGITYLVSRFVSEQNPPNKFTTLESCAHYVSLIPPLNEWKALKKIASDQNFTLTSQQAINILAGNTKEHAVLLANFFLYLSKRRPVDFGADIYLVLGSAVLDDEAVWVMRSCRQSREITLWESTSGCSYTRQDECCPLQRIHCLVSKENIYANRQSEMKPCSLDFDILNRRRWAPLLFVDEAGMQTTILTPIQEEVLNYTPANHVFARELQSDLKESIKSAIRGWRRVTTSFRTDLNAKLTSILDKLEESKTTGRDMIDAALIDDISKARTIFGFPLHFPFANTQDALDRIEATEIHRNMDPSVEFALTVRVFAYPGGVISVWIFICSVVTNS